MCRSRHCVISIQENWRAVFRSPSPLAPHYLAGTQALQYTVHRFYHTWHQPEDPLQQARSLQRQVAVDRYRGPEDPEYPTPDAGPLFMFRPAEGRFRVVEPTPLAWLVILVILQMLRVVARLPWCVLVGGALLAYFNHI
jgi:hypothetical protein